MPSPEAPFEWAVSSGGSASSIAPDGAGGAFVTGIFRGRQLFGSTTLEGYNNYDTFLMHVTALGAIDWAIQGNMSDSFGRSLTHDGSGGALVTGCFSGSSAPARAYVMHVMRSGVIDWVAVAGGKSFDNAYFTAGTSNLAQGTGIVSDGAGGALVTGTFNGAASFGSTTLETVSRLRGDYDGFVMHVTASGVIDWARSTGGTLNAWGDGIAQRDEVGGFLVTGTFMGNVSLGSSTIAGQPLQINSFAASLMPPPPPPPLPPPPSPPVNSGFSWFTSVIDPSLAVVLLFACALLLW
jgi:hypothetical protein